MKWWRSKYVQHLEAENADLKEKLGAYERILIPRLPSRVLETGGSKPVPDGKNNGNIAPVRTKRHSWQEARARLENLSDTQGRALEKAAIAHKNMQ